MAVDTAWIIHSRILGRGGQQKTFMAEAGRSGGRLVAWSGAYRHRGRWHQCVRGSGCVASVCGRSHATRRARSRGRT